MSIRRKVKLEGSSFSHYDLVYLKPLDSEAVKNILANYSEVIVVEENSAPGGAGEAINAIKNQQNALCKLRCLALPDQFIEQGTRQQLLAMVKMDVPSLREFFNT